MKKFLIYLGIIIVLIIGGYLIFGNNGMAAGLLPGVLLFNRKDAVLENKEKEIKEEINDLDKKLERSKRKLSNEELEDYFND